MKQNNVINLEDVVSAEMYSNSVCNKNKNKNMNKNMFQQSTESSLALTPANENRRAPEAQFSLKPSAVSEREPENQYGRRLNWQKDKIIEMRLQIGNFKIGRRYQRARAYISIKTELDKRYMIFMRSNLTTAIDETFRSIKKSDDKVLETVAKDIYNEFGTDALFMGRIRYKVVRGQKISKYHRCNLPLALLAMYTDDNNIQRARFHLLGDNYDFILDNEISEKQKEFYNFEGTWEDNSITLTIDEAFGG
jgi:hypothetical protein